MSASGTYDRIKQGLLNELELHKDEIEGGDLNWFSVKVLLNSRDGQLRAIWQHEENCHLDPAWARYPGEQMKR